MQRHHDGDTHPFGNNNRNGPDGIVQVMDVDKVGLMALDGLFYPLGSPHIPWRP